MTWPFHALAAARTENYLLFTRIKTFSYTIRSKEAISAQKPNGIDTSLQYLTQNEDIIIEKCIIKIQS